MDRWPWQKDIDNPLDLALTKADVVLSQPNPENSQREEQALVELDKVSEERGFHRRYFVETNNAYAIPVSFKKDEPVEITNFRENLIFSGWLETYAVVEIGRLALVEVNIKALCLTFSSLLSLVDTLDYDRLLHVPAYAIKEIEVED